MNDRQLYILAAIVKSYIEEGQPIGSRSLKRVYQLDISPATIRNEMSDLEHLAYLEKAHTSSGRIPTEKAYRWFVDAILARERFDQELLQLGSKSLLGESHDPAHVLQQALEMLSDLSGLTAFAFSFGHAEDVLKRIRLLPISSHELMMVAVYESKHVQTDLLHLSADYSADRLERVDLIFRELFEEKSLLQLLDYLRSGAFSGEYIYGNLITQLLPALTARIEERLLSKLDFQGIGKWFQQVEEEDFPDLLDFLKRLQSGKALREYLEGLPGDQGLVVSIGRENGQEDLKDTAIVSLPYHSGTRVAGYLGLIGPTRMPYGRAIAYTSRLGKYVDSIMKRK